ncbi:MAG: hypothetical protein MJK04_20050 [Psychrosphaera sp.]|nr:hypothetical protein [Psychrosphaera sp.]
MPFKINKPKTLFSTLLLVTTSLTYATPTDSEVAVDVPWEWIFTKAQQQKVAAPCESYPRCYEPPPFAPEPTAPEEKDRK